MKCQEKNKFLLKPNIVSHCVSCSYICSPFLYYLTLVIISTIFYVESMCVNEQVFVVRTKIRFLEEKLAENYLFANDSVLFSGTALLFMIYCA